MKIRKGDVFMQEVDAGHAGIIVDTKFGLSLGHASTTGLKATPLDAHPVHLFRCKNTDLADAAAAQANKWCQRLLEVKESDVREYVPFADQKRQQQVNQLQSQRNMVGQSAKGDFVNDLLKPPPPDTSFFSFLSKPPAPHQLTAQDMAQAEVVGMKAVMRRQDEEFVKFGRFRAIKYAARRNLSVAHVEYDNSAEKGYKLGPSTTCAMFLVLCYQVAGLSPYVDACSSFGDDSWVSNKHSLVLDYDFGDLTAMANMNAYLRYLGDEYGKNHVAVDVGQTATIRGPQSPRTNKTFRSPLSVWTGGLIDQFDFRGKLTAAMCVDAKRCRSPELLARCATDKAAWDYLGFFSFQGKTGDLTALPDQPSAMLTASNY